MLVECVRRVEEAERRLEKLVKERGELLVCEQALREKEGEVARLKEEVAEKHHEMVECVRRVTEMEKRLESVVKERDELLPFQQAREQYAEEMGFKEAEGKANAVTAKEEQ
eukprot:evm.model.NODE_11959_length_1730_cov_13.662428.2